MTNLPMYQSVKLQDIRQREGGGGADIWISDRSRTNDEANESKLISKSRLVARPVDPDLTQLDVLSDTARKKE
jgi:hypothetical protein